MAMSNLYSKFAQMKRNSEPGTPAYMSFSQTPWINGEKSKGKKLLSSNEERKIFFVFSRSKNFTTNIFFRFHFRLFALPNS